MLGPDHLLILVADAGSARLFTRSARGAAIVEDSGFLLHAPARASLRGPLPRSHDRLGPGRHAIEPRTPPRQAAADQFVASIAKAYAARALAAPDAALVLCAPARIMGVLKRRLPQDVGGRVRAALVKDLVNLAPSALPRRLADLLAETDWSQSA